MSWNPFKSKEVTRVGTSVSRVVSDDSIPNAAQAGTLRALFNDGNVPNYIMEELVSSLGVKAERMYRYAEENYVYGLPSGDVYSSTQGRAQVVEVLEILEAQEISIDYSHFGAPNALHIGWMKLVDEYGYDDQTNQLGTLSAMKNFPVYLKDMVVVVPAARINTVAKETIEQWGRAPCSGYTPLRLNNVGEIRNMVSHSPITVSNTAAEIQLRVTYTWKRPDGLLEESITLSINEASLGDGYFHAKYFVGGQMKFWMYENDTGTYPLLDQVFVDAPAAAGSYFPFTYFRYAKQSTISDPTSQAYKTSARMVKYLNMDYHTVASAIDENPDIGDVEQAMMIFAVPSVSTNRIESRYLFDYFDTMHGALGGNISTAARYVLSSSLRDGYGGVLSAAVRESLTQNSTVIQDARFQMILSNNGVHKLLRSGSIGEVDAYLSDYGVCYVEDSVYVSETGTTEVSTTPINVHRYRHQLSANMYEEILVLGLKMTYRIYGGHTTVGDETDDILLIPIDLNVSRNYSIKDREILYTRSLHFVFNSRTVTKVKWYQQEWFSTFLFVVAVVLTILYPPAYLVAAGLTGAALVIASIVINLVIKLALEKVFDFLVKVLGQDVATILAIIALVYVGYQVGVNGVNGAPFASDLLMLSNGLNMAVLKDKFSDLMTEYDQFREFTESQNELLEKANELLENSTVLSPFVIFGEKPEEFYNRTIHFGNIGTLGINAISSYVDIALTLPKLNDTLGEPLNE